MPAWCRKLPTAFWGPWLDSLNRTPYSRRCSPLPTTPPPSSPPPCSWAVRAFSQQAQPLPAPPLGLLPPGVGGSPGSTPQTMSESRTQGSYLGAPFRMEAKGHICATVGVGTWRGSCDPFRHHCRFPSSSPHEAELATSSKMTRPSGETRGAGPGQRLRAVSGTSLSPPAASLPRLLRTHRPHSPSLPTPGAVPSVSSNFLAGPVTIA